MANRVGVTIYENGSRWDTRWRLAYRGRGAKDKARRVANEELRSTWWLRADGSVVQYWPGSGGKLRQHVHPARDVRIESP